MKAISELNREVMDPDGDEYFVVSREENPGEYETYKMKLSALRDYIIGND